MGILRQKPSTSSLRSSVTVSSLTTQRKGLILRRGDEPADPRRHRTPVQTQRKGLILRHPPPSFGPITRNRALLNPAQGVHLDGCTVLGPSARGARPQCSRRSPSQPSARGSSCDRRRFRSSNPNQREGLTTPSAGGSFCDYMLLLCSVRPARGFHLATNPRPLRINRAQGVHLATGRSSPRSRAIQREELLSRRRSRDPPHRTQAVHPAAMRTS